MPHESCDLHEVLREYLRVGLAAFSAIVLVADVLVDVKRVRLSPPEQRLDGMTEGVERCVGAPAAARLQLGEPA